MSIGNPPPRTGPPPQVAPRDPAVRKQDVLALLATERHVWLSSASGDRPHLVPLAYVWDGVELTLATRAGTRTARNLRASGWARAALGTTRDVVMLQGPVSFTDPATATEGELARFGGLPIDPARVPGMLGLHLRPERIQAWRAMSEIPQRALMVEGRWLA